MANKKVEETKVVKMAPVKGTVTAALLRVREKASLDSAILEVLPRGSELTLDVSYPNAQFYKVNYVSKSGMQVNGYCMKQFIEVKDSGSTKLNG
jgi:uncharacterized protein YgiM (DUF1202 family)